MMLKCINPNEAKYLDPASGIHIKFRLAGVRIKHDRFGNILTCCHGNIWHPYKVSIGWGKKHNRFGNILTCCHGNIWHPYKVSIGWGKKHNRFGNILTCCHGNIWHPYKVLLAGVRNIIDLGIF